SIWITPHRNSGDVTTGKRLGLGDARRHRLADVPNAVERERQMRALRRRGGLAPLTGAGQRQRGAASVDVAAREDGAYTGTPERRGGVDASDPRMSVRAPDECDVVQP